jgi:hypothetical protein
MSSGLLGVIYDSQVTADDSQPQGYALFLIAIWIRVR